MNIYIFQVEKSDVNLPVSNNKISLIPINYVKK